MTEWTPAAANIGLAEATAPSMCNERLDAGCVLLVDDEPSVRRGLRRLAEQAGHRVLEAASVTAAKEQLDRGGVDVVLLDVGLAEENGLELLKDIRLMERAASTVVFTGSADRADMKLALASGALSYLRKSADAFTIEAQIEIALSHARAQRDALANRRKIEGSLTDALTSWEMLPRKLAEGLCSAWDLRHIETSSHVRRIGAYSTVLAKAVGFSDKDAAALGDAAILHDLGKIAIPDAILCKAGALTEQEFEIMKRHTVEGAHMLGGIEQPFFQRAAMLALRHHERWDGSGYPDGLVGEACPREARIVGIVDVYDALGQTRCYKAAWSAEQISAFFRERSGKQFESSLVAALFDSIPQLRELAFEIPEAAGSSAVFPAAGKGAVASR
jgi:response regulator RpfG family c-di-GMP phosphodiesterase